MNAYQKIEIQTILAALVIFPAAAAEFLDVAEKADSIERMYFDLAYGVTPALFVIYTTGGDEFLERIRLTASSE